MNCPFCAADETRVLDSRTPAIGRVVRRRACRECGNRFKTLEHVATDALKVRKRDGRTERFDRRKITIGVTKAASGASIHPGSLTAIVDRVCDGVAPEEPGLPVSSSQIGQLVLRHLYDDSHTSDVARVRYAMVFLGKRRRLPSGFDGAQDVLRWLDEEHPDEGLPVNYQGQPVSVIKRQGMREDFSLEKLERSVGIAAKGRGDDGFVHDLARGVGAEVVARLLGQAIVGSQQIAEQVLHALIAKDDIAYLRYASVTKRYTSRWDFRTEISALVYARRAKGGE
ncbi:MAG TPA: ATP cone domain-containing protein [Candidatus Saccharimonadales bacterium]|nr:ATP cone domain-containing protein [Candidatus Saccharimonadales bacterium]